MTRGAQAGPHKRTYGDHKDIPRPQHLEQAQQQRVLQQQQQHSSGARVNCIPKLPLFEGGSVQSHQGMHGVVLHPHLAALQQQARIARRLSQQQHHTHSLLQQQPPLDEINSSCEPPYHRRQQLGQTAPDMQLSESRIDRDPSAQEKDLTFYATCRECYSVGLSCKGERERGSQCARCEEFEYICRQSINDDPRAALEALMAKRLKLSRENHETHTSQRHAKFPENEPNHSEKPTGRVDISSFTQPFLSFISENPTAFHAVAAVAKRLESHGFTKLSERDSWTNKLTKDGKYYFERNGSSIIAFVVGKDYKSGNGASVIASHIDALATRLKPIPTLATKAGYVQLGVAPYAGALNSTWWDRDLGIGGRVLVKDSKTGKIETKLVKLDWPIARIPTLAPHFGAAADISNPNKETQMVPIIGLDSVNSNNETSDERPKSSILGGAGTFTETQPERLVKAIAGEMNIKDYSTIINWELELFDTQPAQLGGLDKEFIFAGRVDDKLCSFAAIEALIASSKTSSSDSGAIKIVGCFDDEEIGSLLRQGAHSNLLPSTLERICEAFSEKSCGVNITSQMYANSFLISADVSHAVNPNFMGAYLENHAPRLNTGIAVQADPNGHTTTDSVSTAFLQRVADKCGAKLQVFQIRNDSRSGGTVGPMLSSAMGMRAIDAGLPQLSMHSIRATIGSLDPGLGVQLFKGFFDHFEEVDAEFR